MHRRGVLRYVSPVLVPVSLVQFLVPHKTYERH